MNVPFLVGYLMMPSDVAAQLASETHDLQAAGKADAVEEQNGISLAVARGRATVSQSELVTGERCYRHFGVDQISSTPTLFFFFISG